MLHMTKSDFAGLLCEACRGREAGYFVHAKRKCVCARCRQKLIRQDELMSLGESVNEAVFERRCGKPQRLLPSQLAWVGRP